MLNLGSQDFPTWVWLIVYGVSILATVLTLAACAFRSLRAPQLWTFLQWSLIGIALFAAADLLNRLSPSENPRLPLTAPVFLLIAVLAGAVIILVLSMQSRWFASQAWWSRWGRPATYLLGYALAVAGFGSRFYQVAEEPPQWQSSLDKRGNQQMRDAGAYAVTDSGRRLPLYQFESTELTKAKLPEQFVGRVVVVKTPENTHSNCHGWVFTGGTFLVRSVYVDDILKDNGYTVVEVPRPGDLIIYRNPAGQPVHTGLVKAAGEGGFVLIESKWGPLGTYLHLPEDQTYSEIYAFYRSERENHRLTIVEGETEGEDNDNDRAPGLVGQRQTDVADDPQV